MPAPFTFPHSWHITSQQLHRKPPGHQERTSSGFPPTAESVATCTNKPFFLPNQESGSHHRPLCTSSHSLHPGTNSSGFYFLGNSHPHPPSPYPLLCSCPYLGTRYLLWITALVSLWQCCPQFCTFPKHYQNDFSNKNWYCLSLPHSLLLNFSSDIPLF